MASPLPSARQPFEAGGERVIHERPQLSLVPASAKPDQNAEATKRSRDRAGFGIAALLASTILFPMADMIAKTLAGSYSGLEVAWMRYVVLVAVVIPLIVRDRRILRTAIPIVQVVRGTASAMATALALIGFMFLPVADATAISFVTPLLVTALAVVLLRETVGWQRWAAAFVGFCGILVIVRPGSGAFQTATLLPLASSCFSAMTVITTRFGQNDRIETTLVYSALVGFVVLTGGAAWTWHTPDTHALGLALAMGIFSTAATVAQIAAYRCAPSSLLAPFSYMQLIWAGGIGWMVFGTVPGPFMLAGSTLVIGSGFFVAVRERAAARPKRRSWAALRKDLRRLPAAA